jgi:hypothetical protein
MYSGTQSGKGIWENLLFPANHTEAFKIMFQGFDMYNKVINASLDFLELASKGKTADIMGNWKDLTSNIYKDYFEALSSPLKMFAEQSFMEKMSWEEPLNAWNKLLEKSPIGVKAPFAEIEDYIKFTKDWQKRCTKLHNTWISCLEKTADVMKSSLEKGELQDKVFLTCMESTEDFMEDWLAFLSEHARAHFKLLKSSVVSKRRDTEKREIEKKESAKAKAEK